MSSVSAASSRLAVSNAQSISSMASAHVRLTQADAAILNSANTESAVSDNDRAMLASLLAPVGSGSSATLLAQVTGGDWSTSHEPDFLAVRTGSQVTSQFSGGGAISSWTNGGDNTTISYFAGGSPPNAYKGVAISYGAEATASDRENEKKIAMNWLGDHLGDHQIAGGGWNRPLIDTRL